MLTLNPQIQFNFSVNLHLRDTRTSAAPQFYRVAITTLPLACPHHAPFRVVAQCDSPLQCGPLKFFSSSPSTVMSPVLGRSLTSASSQPNLTRFQFFSSINTLFSESAVQTRFALKNKFSSSTIRRTLVHSTHRASVRRQPERSA